MLERLDNKYVISGDVLVRALPLLAREFDILEIGGQRVFTYETCYFDDPELSSYYDHHQGRRQRVKVRVRRYVDSDACFVEVKLKDKRGITVKKRLGYDASKFRALDDQALGHIQDCYESMYDRPWDRRLDPVIEMRYRRATLAAREGNERLTIDSGLTFFGRDRETAIGRQLFIIETKSANGRGIGDRILRSLHQHPTKRCSKYCVGMAAVGEADRHNRFLPAMRKLDLRPLVASSVTAPAFRPRTVSRRGPVARLAGWLRAGRPATA